MTDICCGYHGNVAAPPLASRTSMSSVDLGEEKERKHLCFIFFPDQD